MKKVTSFVAFKKAGHFPQLRDDINAALAKVAKKYGVVIKSGNVKYSDFSADIKLQLSIITESGNVESKESEAFRTGCELIGLQQSDLFRKFTYQGHEYQITGLRLGRRNPVYTKRDDGKNFFFAVALTIQSLKHYAVNI